MARIKDRKTRRVARHKRVRRRLTGTAERPRLAVFKSAKHIYAQVIDDGKGATLAAASTLGKSFIEANKGIKPVEAAAKVGELLGSRAKEKGLTQVVFDRGGFPYKGRVKALADAARAAGLEF